MGQVYEGSRVVDLVVVLDPTIRSEVPQVGGLRLRAADGRLVPWRSVADVSLTAGRNKILHAGGRRLQTVTAGFEGRDLQTFEAEVERRVGERVRLSPGNYLVYAGTGNQPRRKRAKSSSCIRSSPASGSFSCCISRSGTCATWRSPFATWTVSR